MIRIFLSYPMKDLTMEQIYDAKSFYEKQFKNSIRVMDRFLFTPEIREKLSDNIIVTIDSIVTTLHKPEDGCNDAIYLIEGIHGLGFADLLVQAPNWKDARGCRIEYQIAQEYNIQTYQLDKVFKV